VTVNVIIFNIVVYSPHWLSGSRGWTPCRRMEYNKTSSLKSIISGHTQFSTGYSLTWLQTLLVHSEIHSRVTFCKSRSTDRLRIQSQPSS